MPRTTVVGAKRPRDDAKDAQCQKCYQRGHWTFACTAAERVYCASRAPIGDVARATVGVLPPPDADKPASAGFLSRITRKPVASADSAPGLGVVSEAKSARYSGDRRRPRGRSERSSSAESRSSSSRSSASRSDDSRAFSESSSSCTRSSTSRSYSSSSYSYTGSSRSSRSSTSSSSPARFSEPLKRGADASDRARGRGADAAGAGAAAAEASRSRSGPHRGGSRGRDLPGPAQRLPQASKRARRSRSR